MAHWAREDKKNFIDSQTKRYIRVNIDTNGVTVSLNLTNKEFYVEEKYCVYKDELFSTYIGLRQSCIILYPSL